MIVTSSELFFTWLQVCVEMEDVLPKAWRLSIFDSLGFNQPLDFDHGDIGVAGGLQVRTASKKRKEKQCWHQFWHQNYFGAKLIYTGYLPFSSR